MALKIFTSILIVYILALNTLPCVDKLNVRVLPGTETSQSPADDHHHDCGQCSPFCTCNCCSSPRIGQVNTIQFISFTYSIQQIAIYKSSFASFHFTSCWHPPKLS